MSPYTNLKEGLGASNILLWCFFLVLSNEISFSLLYENDQPSGHERESED